MDGLGALSRYGTRRNVLRLLAVYSGLGLLQVLWRFARACLESRRMWRMLEPVPFARYKGGGILGCLPELVSNFHRLHDWRADIMQGLPLVKVPFLVFDPDGIAVFVNDPMCVRHFLKDSFDNYTKPSDSQDGVFVYLREWLGDGLFTVLHGKGADDGGRSWALQRKIAANIFTRGNFNTLMQEVFQGKAERLCEELAKQTASGKPMDLQCQFFNFTMDSVMKIFFGEDSDTLGGAPHKYGQAYDVAHHEFFHYSLRAAGFMSLTKLLLPWPFGGTGGLAWRVHATLSPGYRRFRAAVRVLDQESDRLIRACRADPQLPSRRDLLALFVQAEEKQQFSTKFLRDVVLNFVIAGRDTTASLLSWTLYELARHPEVQNQLCKEIDERAPSRGHVSFKSTSQSELPYLHGVLYEALRIWPPVPFDFKVAVQDDVFPNGVKIPAGCKVAFVPYATGRDPERWPDPLAFRPERWIPFTAPAPHDFPVFQAGPRICLGMDMAIFEAKVVLINLLRNFSFELAPGEADKITYTVKLTMNISNNKGREGENEQLLLLVHPRARA